MKVAIVYDRVNKWGGAERVLLELHKIFPDAPLYTSIYDPKKAPWASVFPKVYTSFLNNIPILKNKHEAIGWLMPIAFETFDFRDYDLVISVTSEAAKGIITHPGTKHICYMLTPTRYLWSGYDDYFKNPLLRFVSKPPVVYLKRWDKIAANRPDVVVSISNDVADRVKKHYKRDSVIIFPPVTLTGEKYTKKNRGKHFLRIGRIVPYYKKIDLVVEVFNELGHPLILAGRGSFEKKLKSISKNNIKFLGEVSDKKLINLYRDAKALVMPQKEDFGIVAVEAQSFGVPVIAYSEGGARDTVIDGVTGVLFKKQTNVSLARAIEKFQKIRFNRGALIRNARKFSFETFRDKLLKLV